MWSILENVDRFCGADIDGYIDAVFGGHNNGVVLRLFIDGVFDFPIVAYSDATSRTSWPVVLLRERLHSIVFGYGDR